MKRMLKATGLLFVLLLIGLLAALTAFADNGQGSTAKSTAKRIIFFGDSVTYGTNGARKTDGFSPVKRPYPGLVGDLLGVRTTNKGVGSMGWIGLIEQTAYQKITSTDLSPYDYIVIAMGVNDSDRKLGTWDSADESTVMGQFNMTMEYLTGQGLAEKVIIVAPWKTTKTNRIKMSAAMKQAAEHFGISYISQDDSPITADNIHEALPDGVHPDQRHYEMIAEWLAGKLKPLIGGRWAKRLSWITLDETEFLYTGEAKTPGVKAFGSNKGRFAEMDPDDYAVAYQNNVEAGTAKVTVTGKNGYASKVTAEFKIIRQAITGAKLKYGTMEYTGKARKQSDTTVVTSGAKVLTQGTDYTISYKNNVRVGTATMTVTGKGSYRGTIKKTFTILPARTKLKSVTSSRTGRITVSWEKRTEQTTGYQIQYGTSPDFSIDGKKIKVVGAAKSLRTIDGLKAGKVYYVRIRTYKTVGTKTYYSEWSEKRMVTVRK